MSAKVVTPTLGKNSFTCPHCGTLTHQSWYKIFLENYDKDQAPWMPDPEFVKKVEHDFKNEQQKTDIIKFFERKRTKELFRETYDEFHYHKTELINLYVSLCYTCDKYSIWVADDLIYPAHSTSIQPNEEMPADIRSDFIEASAIVDQSPRGAAALLRLCIQKLMAHLNLKGKHIDDDIGELVKRGLDGRIQKALDIVRVIGNNAVHPGQIDLHDDKAAAVELFNLVNLIVEAVIATPKHIEAMYGDLPETARKAIEERDGKK